MTLATGSILQNGKYFIQKVLHQSDFGLTYQAMHTYLEQPVILQSYNDALQRHDRFDYLRQLFMEEARRRVHQQPPAAAPSADLIILDGFEENGLPYIVIAQQPGQTLPKLRDWLPLTKIIVAQSPETALTHSQPHPEMLASPQTPTPDPVAVERSSDMVNISIQEQSRTAAAEESSGGGWTPPPRVIEHHPSDAPLHKLSSTFTQVPSKPLKKRSVIPLALVAIATLGGIAGASLGWIIRFQPSSAVTSEDPIQPSLLNLGSDQSFPPLDDWPISETQDLTPSAGSWREPISVPDPSVLDIPEPELEPLPEFSQEDLPENLFDKEPEPLVPDTPDLPPVDEDKDPPLPEPNPPAIDPAPVAPPADPILPPPPDDSRSLPSPEPPPAPISAGDFPEPTMQ
jgi:hypothetical protein